MKKLLTLSIIVSFIFSCNKKKATTADKTAKTNQKSPAQMLKQPDSNIKKPVISKIKEELSCEDIYKRHGECFVPKHKVTYNLPINDSGVKGPSDALVTIVEFSDLQCPGCKYWSLKLLPALLKKHPYVRLVYKHFPLSFHHMAPNGAMALEEVRSQKGDTAFWRVHDFLYENQGSFSLDFFLLKTKDKKNKTLVADIKKFTKVLKSLKINIKKFQKAMLTDKHLPKVEFDKKMANDIGVNQTPKIYINGRILNNNENIEDIVVVMKNKALLMVKNGTKKNKIYETIIKNKKLKNMEELSKERKLEILNKFKSIFIPKCKNDPKISPLIKAMKKCSSKTISCSAFQNCVETKINKTP